MGGGNPAPTPQIPVDPNLANEQQQAQQELIKQLQSQAQSDTADLMARYGSQLAISGGNVATAPMKAAV